MFTNGVNFYILDVCVTSVLFFFMNNNTVREIKRSARMAPPTTPAIIATLSCLVRIFGGNAVTCGVSIEGVDETSLHDIVEKERHIFPEVLNIINISE